MPVPCPRRLMPVSAHLDQVANRLPGLGGRSRASNVIFGSLCFRRGAGPLCSRDGSGDTGSRHQKHLAPCAPSRYAGAMTADSDFEIFLVAVPGLEGPLCAEARAKGFKAKSVPGGVTLKGGWPEVWRANL